MAAATTNDQFLDVLRKSRLLESTRIDEFLENSGDKLPSQPRQLAEAFVRQGYLTPFQAGQLLSGKHKGYLIADGKYKLLQLLGVGGMGKVYLCEHIRMKRLVALKVLPLEQTQDPGALERFNREAQASAALNHPNIVRAFDIDQDGPMHFLVMEHVDGSSLQEIVKKHGPLDVSRACHYISQAAIGLQHASEAGWVHRDIKPGNLLLDRGGTIKILDMGLARLFQSSVEDGLTQKFDNKSILGTADYLAPEQAVNSSDVDVRADIYSLGATLYYLLTGKGPFESATVTEKLLAHQMQEPVSVCSLRPEVPKALSAVLKKMMAKKPVHRFQTPMAVAEALQPWTVAPVEPPADEEMPRLCLALESYAMNGSGPMSGINGPASARLRSPRSNGMPSGHLLQNGTPGVSRFRLALRKVPQPWLYSAAALFGVLATIGIWAMVSGGKKDPSLVAADPVAQVALKPKPVVPMPSIATTGILYVTRGIQPSHQTEAGTVVASLAEAIQQSGPRQRIVICDALVEGRVILNDATRFAGVSIESGLVDQQPVNWQPGDGAADIPMVDIAGVADVRFSGIQFNAQQKVDTIVRVSGAASGVRLESILFTDFKKSPLVLDGLADLAIPVTVTKTRFLTTREYAKTGRDWAADVRPCAIAISVTAPCGGPMFAIHDCRFEGLYQAAIDCTGPVSGEVRRCRMFTLKDEERPAAAKNCDVLLVRPQRADDKVELKLASNTAGRYPNFVRLEKLPDPGSKITIRSNIMLGGNAWAAGPTGASEGLFAGSGGNVCRPNTCTRGYASVPRTFIDFKYMEVGSTDQTFMRYPAKVPTGAVHELLHAGADGEPAGFPPGD